MRLLFSTAYLPPISFIARLISSEKIILEKHEHYVKQTYRNRALVYGANGIHSLIVPIHHEGNERNPIGERKISYDSQWQKIHWRTITSAYRNSPFFEYFEDDFRTFYEIKTETLFEFNFILLKKILSLMQIPFEPEYTAAYNETVPGTTDLRNAFDPSRRDETLPEYNQVFGERFGFIQDLSIVDLLFNKGMEAMSYLAGLNIRG